MQEDQEEQQAVRALESMAAGLNRIADAIEDHNEIQKQAMTNALKLSTKSIELVNIQLEEMKRLKQEAEDDLA